jgi:hypothetical protein
MRVRSDVSAMRPLRETRSESVLVEHEPSPRAMPYFCRGEWDLFSMLVLLTICQEIDACFGPLPPAFSTPRNIPKCHFKALSRQASKLRVHA